MRDVDDVVHAEENRCADCDRRIKSTEQDPGDQRVDKQIEAEAHLLPQKALLRNEMRAGEPFACQCAGTVAPWLAGLDRAEADARLADSWKRTCARAAYAAAFGR